VEYVGPFDAVHVPDLNDRIVERGQPIDVPDELAERLLKQDVWHGVGVPRALRPRGSRPDRDTTPSEAGPAGEEG